MSVPPTALGSPPEQLPIWSRPVRHGRGPAPAHTREAIAAAAVALADAEGLGAVSMRAVAAALGTGAGSLYRYLSSRDDLLDLMSDHVVRELRPYPDGEADWLEALVLVGRGQLALHRRHAWLLDTGPRASGIGPESLAWFDACLRILEPVAAPVSAKLEAVALMTGVVTLVARSETGSRSFPTAGVDLGGYPHLAAALAQPAGPPPAPDLFGRTVRILLTGMLVLDPPTGA